MERRELEQRKQALDQFGEAIKRLGDPVAAVRAAGILTLQQAAKITPEFSDSALETILIHLQSRVVSPTDVKQYAEGHVPADIQAVINVLSLRGGAFSGYRFPKTLFDNLDLTGARFVQTAAFKGFFFRGGKLWAVDMSGSDLSDAVFDGADMNDSGAFGKFFSEDEVLLSAWDDWKKYVYAAKFSDATLEGASFANAGLVGAIFKKAKLRGAHFRRSNISRADFRGAIDLNLAKFEEVCSRVGRNNLPVFDDMASAPDIIDCDTGKKINISTGTPEN